MSGGGGESAPSNTTSNSTNTVIQDVPAWEQQYLTGLLGQAQTAASQPYQQFPGQQDAGFTPDQTQAFSNIENLINGGQSAATGAAATNSALSGSNTANGIYGAGAGDINAATAYNPLAAASPLIGAAANAGTPQGISSYLSPYTNNVVQGLVNTANQNWNQNLMPSVNDAFIGSGQFASGRNAQVLGQAANQEQTNLNSAVANALQSGYSQASANAANQASTLGNLANTTASATNSQAQNLQSAGTNLGNLASTQAGAQGNAAANLANTANTVQNTGIAGNSALQAVGQQQQTQNQTNLNTAQSNFQNQVQYPEQQLSFLSDIIRGLPAPTSSASAVQTPTTTSQIGSVSPLSTLGGTILGAAGLGAGSKEGGLIKGYAAGGMVDDGIEVSGPPVDETPLSPLSTLPVNDNEVSSSTRLPSNPYSESQSPLQAVTPEGGSEARNFQLLSMARGLLTPAHSGAEALGNGIGDYLKTSMDIPDYQTKVLNLQRQQALQPLQIASMKQAYGQIGSPTGASGNGQQPMSVTDQQFASAYRLALMSGDMKTAANVMQSWAEHNPQLAGEVKHQQELNTFQKTPQGTYAMPNSQSGTAPIDPVSSQEIPPVPASALPPPPSPSQIPNNPFAQDRTASFMPPQTPQVPTSSPPKPLMASDGKPIVPNIDAMTKFKPDPSGIPSYGNIPNTETGVALQKSIQDEDVKGNAEMTANLSSIQKEQYRLKQLSDVYKQAQSGTLLAQNPDVANQLVAWGVIKDPSQIHDLAMIQKGVANQAIQIIQQTKDANANLGGAPSRLFGSEISNMQEKAENAGSQPEANYEVITDAMGLANHAADMAKGWDSIGGLGNRLANGNTMRPADYARQFITTHDPQDYKLAAQKTLGTFKGMSTPVMVKTQADIDQAPKGALLIVNGKKYTKK